MGEKKHEPLWTIEQLQEFLQLPRATTYMLVASGKIPHVPLGKHRRFDPDLVKLAIKRLSK